MIVPSRNLGARFPRTSETVCTLIATSPGTLISSIAASFGSKIRPRILPGTRFFNRQSSIVNRQSSIVNRQSSIVDRQSSIVNRQSSIVNRRSSIVNRQSSIANRQSECHLF
jgi:hypothetical protein